MYLLSPLQLSAIWEQGLSQTPVQRAMTILNLALPAISRSDLELLSVGQRNLHLLNIRKQLFGPSMSCVLLCHSCNEVMEFTLDIDALVADVPDTPPTGVLEIEQKYYQFRLINCQDLAIAAQQADLDKAEKILVERCITLMDSETSSSTQSNLTETVIHHIANEIKRRDPNAELLIHLTCPDCHESRKTVLDIVDFLWNEIIARAKHFLLEVHQLAKAYGWSEADVLSLSAARRQYYLQQLSNSL